MTPAIRLNRWVKYLVSLYPTSEAIEAMVSFVVRSSSFARSIRISVRYSRNPEPVSRLNSWLKYDGLNPTASATCSSEMPLSR